jgi:GT2 family glycosyltransferase
MATVSVVVLSWNGEDYLKDCLASVLSQTVVGLEVILVDNASADNSVALTRREFPTVRIVQNDRNLGVAAGMNIGLEASLGDIVVLLNQDTVVDKDWLAALVECMSSDQEVAIAGCKIVYPDGKTLQHVGASLSYRELDDDQYAEISEADYVTGAAMAIRKATLREIGFFDEGFSPAYFEDVDLCFRARYSDHRVVCVPQARVIHHEATSVRLGSYRHHYYVHKNRVRFLLKHYAARQLLDDFVPAEMARLRESLPWVEVHALRRAYLDNLLALPGLLYGVHPTPEGEGRRRERLAIHLEPERGREIAAALCALREQALKEESGTDGKCDPSEYRRDTNTGEAI